MMRHTFKEMTEGRAGFVKILVVLVLTVFLVSGIGFAVGNFLGSESAEESSTRQEMKDDQSEQLVYVPFGSVVVNLAEGRLTRYLKITVTLQVEKRRQAPLTKTLESGQRAVFQNWLITYLSDLKLESVKGSQSIEQLREEILKGFNRILRRTEDYKIESVFFEEFNVQ